MKPGDECDCLRFGPTDYERVFVGVDKTNSRYGEVEVLTCRRCRRRWLHYLAEYESFTGSGRWIVGILPGELPMPLTPENAVPLLNSLPWYIYGGSAFSSSPAGSRARGNAPADLTAWPGERVANPYDSV